MPTENNTSLPLPEVKRWQLKGFIPGVEGESEAVFRPVVVLEDDFDRVTAEREGLHLSLTTADQTIDDLQSAITRRAQRIKELETALGGMLFAFDDGVGRGWSEDLLDFARKLIPALEFKPAQGERDHQIPDTSGMRLNMLANQGE
jgi:hypothetical protein